MDAKHLQALLNTATSKQGDDGWWELPEGHSLTLYGGRAGVSIAVSKVTGLKQDGDLVSLRTAKGDTYVVVLADMFAGSVEGTFTSARKAGFL